jgi:hypothetical protein
MRTHRPRLPALLAGAVVALLAASAGPAGAAEAHPGALARTLANALAASRAQTSVFWKGTTTADGATIVETTNAGIGHGTQTVAIDVGTRDDGKLSIELFENTVYMRGTTADSLAFQGFTTAAATAEANQWIAIPSNQPFFQVVAAGLTVKTTVQELELTGHLKPARRTKVRGRSVIGIKGTLSLEGVSGPAVLYVRSQGTPLPVEETMSGGGIGIVTLGRWGETITMGLAPSGAVPFDPAWVQQGSTSQPPSSGSIAI